MELEEKVIRFLKCGEENKVASKMMINSIFLLVLFLAGLLLVGRRYTIIKSITIILLIVYAIEVFFCVMKNRKNENTRHLFLGIESLTISFTFLLIGIVCMKESIDEKGWIIFSVIVCIIYILLIIGSIYLTRYWVKKDFYRKTNRKISLTVITGGSLAGIIAGRIIFQNLSVAKIYVIIAILSLLITVLCVIGVPNLYKYYLSEKLRKKNK